MTDITVVGTGVMGSAVARACAAAGLAVSVWNRTPSRVEEFVPAAAHRHETLADALRASPVVVLGLVNYETCAEVLGPVAGLLAGRTVVQTASGVPDHVAPFADLVRAAGGRVLEAAILNYPQAVGTDACFTVYSGPTDVYRDCAVLVGALGGTAQYLGGQLSLAKAYHVVSAAYYYSIVVGFLECSAIATSMGVPLDEFAKSIPMYHPGLQDTIDRGVELIQSRSYTFEQAPLTTHVDILRNLTQVARAAGVDRPYVEVLGDRVQRALDDGYRREHVAVVYEQFRTAVGS